MNDNTPEITLYGTTWCGDSRRTRRFLDEHHIPYNWVDIDQDAQTAQTVKGLNHGMRSVPTIVWKDGTFLVEPSNQELAKKLGITLA